MKYLPFYYYVPRAHRRFSPPLSPSPFVPDATLVAFPRLVVSFGRSRANPLLADATQSRSEVEVLSKHRGYRTERANVPTNLAETSTRIFNATLAVSRVGLKFGLNGLRYHGIFCSFFQETLA